MMRKVNMHEAKTNLSRLVKAAEDGEPFIIARGGKPIVKVVALDWRSDGALHRLGFMDGEIAVPDDFDRMGGGELETSFGARK